MAVRTCSREHQLVELRPRQPPDRNGVRTLFVVDVHSLHAIVVTQLDGPALARLRLEHACASSLVAHVSCPATNQSLVPRTSAIATAHRPARSIGLAPPNTWSVTQAAGAMVTVPRPTCRTTAM